MYRNANRSLDGHRLLSKPTQLLDIKNSNLFKQLIA